MDDVFFGQNEVTYAGQRMDEGESVDVFKVLTSVLTPTEKCMIMVSTTFDMLPTTLTLTGAIQADGVTCKFDGTSTVLMTPVGDFDATITSGSAMLSDNGQALSMSEIMAVVTANGMQFNQTVAAFGPCDCVSVAP
jgi:hypothetical protein